MSRTYPADKEPANILIWPLRGIAVLALLSLLALTRTWQEVTALRSRLAI